MKKGFFILIFIISGFLITIHSFKAYDDISILRQELTDVKTTEGYEKNFNLAIDNLLLYGDLKEAHREWIKKLIKEEYLKDKSYKDTTSYLMLKLRDKSLNFETVKQAKIKLEVLRIKEMQILRERHVDLAIEKYNEKRSEFLARTLENIFFDRPIGVDDIKYF